MSTTQPSAPALVCPGCGSLHVELERGLLFCGTCGTTVDPVAENATQRTAELFTASADPNWLGI